MRRFPTTLIGLLAALFALTSCGEVAERATEEAIEQSAGGDGEVDIDFDDDGGSFSVEGEDGSIEYDISGEGGGDLPDDFPDVPLPDDLSIMSSAKQSAGDETLWSVTGQVGDEDAEGVFADIVDTYESDGWDVQGQYENTANGDFSGGAQFIDGDTSVSASVFGGESTGQDGTTVSFTVTQAPESGAE